MTIEERVFRKCVLIPERLVPFGFAQKGNAFHYEEDLLDGRFRALIEIDPEGSVTGSVLERDMDYEEYDALRIESLHGEYVNAVRDAYRDLLERIKALCFLPQPYSSAQANRMIAMLGERYGERLDYPFEGDDDYGVVRNGGTKKWYALFMPIKRGLLTKEKDDTLIDVVNLKIDPSEGEQLRSLNGIYPAYHMNHVHWVTVVLDESQSDDMVLSLLEKSRALVGKKR